MTDIIVIVVSVLLIAAGLFWRKTEVSKLKGIEKPSKKQKRGKLYATFLAVVASYILVTRLITVIFGPQETKQLTVSIATERINLFGMNVSTSIVLSWCIMAVVLILALIARFTVIPRLKDEPKGAQNVLELAIETITAYTKQQAHGVTEVMASYIFTVAIFLIGCACTELFGFRTPASDVTVTAALAIVTFFLINYYGFKIKGFGGRMKAFANPIHIVTSLAIPVSLACRLFGNMLGGLVVMDLLYMALGGYAVGIPSVLGLFFNVFHPLIQAFIFVTLTLNFINEATE